MFGSIKNLRTFVYQNDKDMKLIITESSKPLTVADAIKKYKSAPSKPVKRFTLAQLNKKIGEKYPKVFLSKGEGNWFLASDDIEVGEMLAGFAQTSINTCYLSQMPIERWLQDVDTIMKQKDNPDFIPYV